MANRLPFPRALDTVGARILAVLGVLLVALVAIVLAAGWRASAQSQDVRDSTRASTIVTTVQQGALAWLYSDTLAGRFIVQPSPELEAAIHGTEAGVLTSIDAARALELGHDSAEVADLDAIRAQAEQATITRQLVLEATNRGDQTAAGQILLQGVTDSQSVTDAFTRITNSATAEVTAASARSQRTATTVTWLLISATVMAAVLVILAALAISRSVVRPLSHLRETAKAVGSGNLAVRADVTGPREIRELALVLNSTVTSLAERDSLLASSRERWRTLVENSHDLVLVVKAAGKVAFANSALETILGYKVDDFIGTDASAIVHPDDRETSNQMFARAAAGTGGSEITEARIRRADGTYAYMEGVPSRIRWEDGYAVLLNARDVSEQRQAKETIAHMAYHDSLTGLPNRLLLQDRLIIAIAQARRTNAALCVMSVDVDRFKNVNDLLGHSAGDELLKAVADRLSGLVRDGDTVARLGGDEFLLVFPDCVAKTYAEEAALRIVNGFRRPFRIADRELHITVSAGFALFPENGSEGATLTRNADVALYAAKEAGRDTFRGFADTMNLRTAEWFVLEGELRKAIVGGEIVVYYQPQVRVDTGEIIGAEALVRWLHPERGLVPPMEFIPLAEETGLINELGELVLRKACLEAITWSKPLRVSVNVSLRQFERPDFVDRVQAIVRETGISPERLELEITETTALRDVEKTREIAGRLAAAGMRISIDDFGTGNTALRYLKELPLNTVKIDQGFILKLLEDPSNAAIAGSIISLGHKLNLNVIAEGVETEEQLQFLRNQGCDEFQGFLISRPVPAAEFRSIADLERAVVPNVA
ncbi:MAG: EAL domain-containing protein [Chloroflexota bacterium]